MDTITIDGVPLDPATMDPMTFATMTIDPFIIPTSISQPISSATATSASLPDWLQPEYIVVNFIGRALSCFLFPTLLWLVLQICLARILLHCMLSKVSLEEPSTISHEASEAKLLRNRLKRVWERKRGEEEENPPTEANNDIMPVEDTSAGRKGTEDDNMHDKPNSMRWPTDDQPILAQLVTEEPSSRGKKSIRRFIWLVYFVYMAGHLTLTLVFHIVTLWKISDLSFASRGALATLLFILGTAALVPIALVYRCIRAVRKHRAKAAFNEVAPELGAMELVEDGCGEAHERGIVR
ncbi:hypothetical protein LTR86_002171 [Recurvomyces mirabilis]|nr:hypothetical protein LTR86_002171 [Recurvomyces mirabilis]